jgi:putative component of membrane protein insertase Oxa1/YidC/SpoIIIJ protein YidD
MLRGLLREVIRFYRRRLSGRGPFARVRCTFSGLESCSAFAERVVAETPSTLLAVRRIRRRLARCRDLSLYCLPGGRLGWGSGYDAMLTAASPQEAASRLGRRLAEEGEGVSVCAAVRRAAVLVAEAAEGAPRTALPEGRAPLPVLREVAALRRVLQRRLWERGLLAVVAAAGTALALLGGPGTALAVACLLVAAGALVRMRAARAQLRRLEWLEVLACVTGPGVAARAAMPGPRCAGPPHEA